MNMNDRLRKLEVAAAAAHDPYALPASEDEARRQLVLPVEQRSPWGVRMALTLAIMHASVPSMDKAENERQASDIARLRELYETKVKEYQT
jgi:hypothetical protein